MVRVKSRLAGDEDPLTQKEVQRKGDIVAKPLTEDEAIRRRSTLHPVSQRAPTSVENGSTAMSNTPIIELRIASIVSFYPSCDYSLTRDERRETLAKKDMELSPIFTTLFDHSYLPTHAGSTTSLNANPYGGNSTTSVNKLQSNKNTLTPANTNQLDGANQKNQMNRNALTPVTTNQIDRSNPYLSPGKAAGSLLADALPDNIVLVTCEWDMLQAEAMALKKRLEEMDLEDEEDTENLDPNDQNNLAEPVDGAPAIVISEDGNNNLVKHQAHRKKRKGKRVVHRMVEGAPHGWDKHPNPWKEAKQSREFYSVACEELKRAFTFDHASAVMKGNE